MKRKLSFGISPCPNDTYIFGALFKGYLKKVPFKIEYVLKDVEELNKMAYTGICDVIKVSVAVYSKVKKDYVLLKSGAALGRGCGPVVVSRTPLNLDMLKRAVIGIPGKNTTAYLLFLKAIGDFAGEVREIRYDRIVHSVLEKEVDAGILIHEARFSYKNYGLCLVEDLGRWWEQTTNLPIPLGCILAKKELGQDMHHKLEELIQESIFFAQKNIEAIWPFIKNNAQEMEDNIIKRHIMTFVTNFSIDLGSEGLNAIEKLILTL
jgi:1,4-dihydroxy-6-naphthoate synthase